MSMFQPFMDFFAQFFEQLRIFLAPLNGHSRIAGLPILQRSRADGIILNQRSKIIVLLEGLLDTGLQVFETADDSRDRILGSFVAHLLHYACLVRLCAPG